MANILRKGDRVQSAYVPSTSYITTTSTSASNRKQTIRSKFNTWESSKLWIESISKEESTRKQWEQMYGWMADIDAKGNIKPKQSIGKNSTRFADTIPDSSSHDYGWHLQTSLGKEIRSLQTRLDQQYKKRLPPVALGPD